MKRWRASCGFLCVLLLTLGSLAGAKSYSLARVEQDVYFRPDGTVRVEDTRTLVLDGDFSDNTYFVDIDPVAGGSVTFEGVEAVDGKTPVQTFVNGNEISWKVRGEDETRIFRFSYVLTSEMQVAADAARFDRQVLEPAHPPVGAYALRLHPSAPSPEQFKVFVFTGSGRIGTLDIAPNAGLATVTVPTLGENEPLRSVVLLEAGLFNFQNVQGQQLDTWLAQIEEETRGFRDASRRAVEQAAPLPQPAPLSPLLLIPLWLVVALVALWLWRTYRRYGLEPATDVGPYYREPAEAIPPAAVPFVLSQNPPGMSAASPAIAATLLDFARRGFLRLETSSSEGFLGFGKSEEVTYHLAEEPDPNSTTPFERELWRAFRGSSTDGTPQFDAEALRAYFSSHPDFARGWINEPRAWYESTHGPLLDPESGRRAGPIVALCVLGALCAGFLGFQVITFSPLVGVNLFAAAVLLLLLSLTAQVSLKRWNADKLLNAKRWEAYKRFLSDFSLVRESPAEHYKLWDYHFVYATALGVSKQYLRNLKKLMTLEPDKFVTPYWLGAGYGGVPGAQLSKLSTLDTLTTSLNTLTQIETNLGGLESALSPQTKTGGGFSGGGFSGGGGFGGSSGGGGSSGMR